MQTEMSIGALVRAGREPPVPWTLEHPKFGTLRIHQWLRVLPGQRYVGAAQWQGQSVLVKLLVGHKAERHFRREWQGATWLQDQHIQTPELLHSGFVPHEGGWLIFEYLAASESLHAVGQAVLAAPALTHAQHQLLTTALSLIAQLHRQGLWQEDLHLDNLLCCHQRLYLIDGGGVRAEHPGKPLSLARVVENLSVFFAQLPPAFDRHLAPLCAAYQTIYSIDIPLERLSRQIGRVRHKRSEAYVRKSGRDCSLFRVRRGLWGLEAVWRAAFVQIQPVLTHPDHFIEQGHLYKTGGAATVARVTVGQAVWVIKRYNIKNWAHWLKRFWRPSRAWHSWQEAQRLSVLGIATPQPIAVVESCWFGLRSRAWLITEYLAGHDILALFQPYQDQDRLPEPWLRALDELFARLIAERISHGDLKGHNIFWDERVEQWALIDLDATTQHRCAWRFVRAYRQDRARFLRNWPVDTALYRQLDQRLPKL